MVKTLTLKTRLWEVVNKEDESVIYGVVVNYLNFYNHLQEVIEDLARRSPIGRIMVYFHLR